MWLPQAIDGSTVRVQGQIRLKVRLQKKERLQVLNLKEALIKSLVGVVPAAPRPWAPRALPLQLQTKILNQRFPTIAKGIMNLQEVLIKSHLVGEAPAALHPPTLAPRALPV